MLKMQTKREFAQSTTNNNKKKYVEYFLLIDFRNIILLCEEWIDEVHRSKSQALGVSFPIGAIYLSLRGEN